MKTIREWLSELPYPLNIRALRQIRSSVSGEEQVESMSDAIMAAISWALSDEGETCWSLAHRGYYFEAINSMDPHIVQLYNGNYALRKNCVPLTKGEHTGEYAMTKDCVLLIDNNLCLTSDDYIEDNRGRKCMTDDCDQYNIVWSDYEGKYYHRDDVVYGYVSRRSEDYFESGGEEVYCDGTYYLNDDVANAFDIHWDEHYQEYRHIDDMWSEDEDEDEDEDEVDNGNAGYHNMSRKNKRTKKGWSVGFEVEKEDADFIGDDANKIHESTGWCKERDGSLDDKTGFEMVSPTLSLYDDKAVVNSFKSVEKYINANKSTNCGGHIHIGHDEYTPEEIFEGLSGYFPLFYALYHKRLNVDYCRGKKKSEMAHKKEKYSAIYIRQDLGTIEFRIISAVKNMTNIIWRWELMKIVCKGFCKSEIQVAKDMVNKNSKLHKHLLKVYTHEEILDKVNLFIKYSRQYNDKVITNITPFKEAVASATEV